MEREPGGISFSLAARSRSTVTMNNESTRIRRRHSMYFISILAVILVTVILTYSVSLQNFMSWPSLLLILLLSIPILISSGLFRDFNNAFHIALGKKKDSSLIELKRASEAVDMMVRTFLCSGLFLFLTSSLMVLHALDTPWSLGPALSVTLLCFIYGAALALLLLPIKSILQVRIIEFMPESEDEILQEKNEIR